MSIDRRKFIKLASTAAAMGLSGFGAFERVFAKDIIPEELPLNGKRWAMVIDIRKCAEQEDCHDCMNACHFHHNVPDIESREEEIKWIWKEQFHNVFHEQSYKYIDEELGHQPTLVFCNHCDNPPCVRVCPTKSTWKRDDGVVMMDMHRCIGCRYCVAACPYGSRSFNWKDPVPDIDKIYEGYPTRCKGVVEKCNFCAERLARGIEPACAMACKHDALTFGDMADPQSEVRKLVREHYTLRRKPGLGTEPQVYYII